MQPLSLPYPALIPAPRSPHLFPTQPTSFPHAALPFAPPRTHVPVRSVTLHTPCPPPGCRAPSLAALQCPGTACTTPGQRHGRGAARSVARERAGAGTGRWVTTAQLPTWPWGGGGEGTAGTATSRGDPAPTWHPGRAWGTCGWARGTPVRRKGCAPASTTGVCQKRNGLHRPQSVTPGSRAAACHRRGSRVRLSHVPATRTWHPMPHGCRQRGSAGTWGQKGEREQGGWPGLRAGAARGRSGAELRARSACGLSSVSEARRLYFLAEGSKSSGTRTGAVFLMTDLHESVLQPSARPADPGCLADPACRHPFLEPPGRGAVAADLPRADAPVRPLRSYTWPRGFFLVEAAELLCFGSFCRSTRPNRAAAPGQRPAPGWLWGWGQGRTRCKAQRERGTGRKRGVWEGHVSTAAVRGCVTSAEGCGEFSHPFPSAARSAQPRGTV